MPSIDAVIQALKDYSGTLIFVSHDIHFIRSLAKRTIRIEAGKTTHFAGDYDYYLWKSGSASAQTGLVEGLRDARPDSTSRSQEREKPLSAKGAGVSARRNENGSRQNVANSKIPS